MLSALLAFWVVASGLEQTQLVVVPSDGWTPQLLEDLHAGLAALPEAARAFPGGPLEIELHAEPAPLGLGGGAQPFFTQGLGRVHLYAYQEDDDRRAQWRLERLSAEERERLWRRRAIVHAVIRRWDQRLRWSARLGWEQLVGWGGPRPLISYPWAFSRRAGMESSALDLATFAEELLVPAESISPGAVAADDRVRCRELSKARFLDDRLAGLDRTWSPARDCPQFEAWADPERVLGFEVGFAAPSTVGAQSLFGHVFLAIVRGPEEPVEQREVLQLAALISPLEPRGLSYLGRGLTGGYRGVFVLTHMTEVMYEALELEQRSLRRFRLAVNPLQRLRLLERIWELERIGYVDYRFLDANCASMLRFLLAPALGEGAPGPPLTPWETPAQVLEALGTRLAVPQLEEATGERARRVGAQRRTLVKQVPGEAIVALGGAWPAVARLDSVADAERAAAYAALGATGFPPQVDAWRARVLLASLRIERHALDLASVARISAERSTVLPGWKGPTTPEVIEARQQRYQKDLSPRRIASDALGDLIALDAVLRTAPRRPLLLRELAAIAAEATARETFDAASSAVAALPEDVLSAALDEERAELEAFHAGASTRSVPESGYGQAYAGAGVTSAMSPLLRLELALLREELGDQRERGYGSRSELHVLEGSLDLSVGPRVSVERARVLVVGASSIGARGWGWGGQLDYGFAAGSHALAAQLQRLWVFAADERLTNFVMASLGARAGVQVDTAASALVVPRLGLSGRIQLPGSFGNALRLEAGYAPRLRVGAQVRFEHEVQGRAQLSVRIGALAGFAVTARADVEAQWRPGAAPQAVAGVGFVVD